MDIPVGEDEMSRLGLGERATIAPPMPSRTIAEFMVPCITTGSSVVTDAVVKWIVPSPGGNWKKADGTDGVVGGGVALALVGR